MNWAIALGASLIFLSAQNVRADQAPVDSATLQKRLATYDPKAVAAARHYFERPKFRSNLIEGVSGNIAAELTTHSKLDAQQIYTIKKVTQQVMENSITKVILMLELNSLDVFSSEEMIALDNFYSSPVGARIMEKLPQLTASIPRVLDVLLPDIETEIFKESKAKGVEVCCKAP